MSPITPEMCRNMYRNEVCKEKAKSILREYGLPDGLFPVEELGYVKETGFMWVKQKNEIEHKFEKVGKHVSYATEFTSYMEKCKIKKLTGVKTKDLMIWISHVEIFVDDPPSEKITMKTPTGIYRTFPKEAFAA
ncbi:uncharacterized protein [Rutidosis leptorrhynchoides]|uniref:uncharacterized protein n=1 Tax=Rutidosis leptorrhynchoides TaxID=125765 RepID=UPI003A9A4792